MRTSAVSNIKSLSKNISVNRQGYCRKMGLINDILLGFTLLACILKYNTQFAAGVENQRVACFFSRGARNLEGLKEIQICGHNEICYFKHFLDDNLSDMIAAGCRSKKDCKIGECAETFYKDPSPENETLFRTRKEGLVLCEECCYTSLCNKQGCGLVSNLSSVPRKCFGTCTNVVDMKKCLTLIDCESDAFMCATQVNLDPFSGYNLGCVGRKMCELLMMFNESIDKCCDSDLCNIIPKFEYIFNGTETDDVACPRDLIPSTITTRTSTQSPATITSTQSPANITSTQSPTTITSTQSPTTITSTQSPVTITSTQSPTTITSTQSPTTITSTQSPTTITSTQSPTTIKSTQSPATITSTQSATTITSTQSPTTIKSTQSPASITGNQPPATTIMTMTESGTIAPTSPRTPTIFDTTKGVLSTMPAVASRRPPVTLPPVQQTCIVCTGDSTPDTCEYQYEETQCNPPNNYCMNIITNTIIGTRTVERKCSSFEDCYNNWWQGSSDEELCQTYTPDVSLTANFQCSFCCTVNKCNQDLKPPRNTLYQDN